MPKSLYDVVSTLPMVFGRLILRQLWFDSRAEDPGRVGPIQTPEACGQDGQLSTLIFLGEKRE